MLNECLVKAGFSELGIVSPGSSRIVIIFTCVHSVRWEGGSRGAVRFSDMSFNGLWCIAILRRGRKIIISEVLFW